MIILSTLTFFPPLLPVDLTRNLAESARGTEHRAQAIIEGVALNAVLGTDEASLVADHADREEAVDGAHEAAGAALDLLGVLTVLAAGAAPGVEARVAVLAAAENTRAPGGSHFFCPS